MLRIRLRRFFAKLHSRRSFSRGRGHPIRGIIIFLVVFAVISGIIIARLRPAVAQMADYIVTSVATEKINDAISEKISDGSLDYDDLVILEKDENGEVTALQTNMAKINVLQTEITNVVIQKLSDQMNTEIKVPLGNIIGGTVFSGRGPGIPVRIVSVSNVTADFTNEFSSAGINQTRHQIILNIKVDIDMLIPGGTVQDTVKTSMVIAETVIVGTVPGTYADLSGEKLNIGGREQNTEK